MATDLDRDIKRIGDFLTGAGQMFETRQVDRRGVSMPAFVNAPPTLAHFMAHFSNVHKDAVFIVDGDRRMTFGEVYAAATTMAVADRFLVEVMAPKPVAVAILALQRGDPVHPEPRLAIAAGRPPQRHIGLGQQKFARPVVRSVVHHQEVVDAKAAVVGQEVGQPHTLIPDGREEQDRLGGKAGGVVGDGGQLAATAEGHALGNRL